MNLFYNSKHYFQFVFLNRLFDTITKNPNTEIVVVVTTAINSVGPRLNFGKIGIDQHTP